MCKKTISLVWHSILIVIMTVLEYVAASVITPSTKQSQHTFILHTSLHPEWKYFALYLFSFGLVILPVHSMPTGCNQYDITLLLIGSNSEQLATISLQVCCHWPRKVEETLKFK